MTDDLETKRMFATAMLAMWKSFGRDVDKDVNRICFSALMHLPLEDACKCIELAILNSDRFPSPHQLRSFQSMIPRKDVPKLPHNPVNNATLKDDAMKLINLVLDGKISKENHVEGMMVMEKKYPGIGWRDEASQLAAYHSRNERANCDQ